MKFAAREMVRNEEGVRGKGGGEKERGKKKMMLLMMITTTRERRRKRRGKSECFSFRKDKF